jgi:hypothetical protein
MKRRERRGLSRRAQQADRVRRIGVLMAAAENDQERQGFVAALREANSLANRLSHRPARSG